MSTPCDLVELVNRGALQHPMPGDDVVLEASGEHRRRMQRQVAAEPWVRAKAAAPQQSGRLGGTGRHDDRVGQDVQRRAVGPAGPHTPGAAVPVQHPLDAGLGDDPRARRARLRQGVEVHAELGVAGAADRALATAFTARRVARDGRRPPTQRGGGVQQQAPVVAHDLQRHRGHPQRAFHVVEVFGEPVGIGQSEPELVVPAPLHGRRRAVAGAGVHHRGAADRPADGQHHRWASQGDGGPGAAVQPGIAVDGMGGAEFLHRPPSSLLENDDGQSRPGQGAGHHRAAGAGPHDHRIGGHDGAALGRGDDVQRCVGAGRSVLPGVRKQFRRIGFRAVGKQHDRLHGLDGRTGVRAQRGDPPQHLITSVGAEPRQ